MENIYNAILLWVRKNKQREAIIIFFCKFLPYITAFSYIGIIIYVMLFNIDILFPILFIPGSIFIFVTIIRKIWNRPRPYETLNIDALFQNKKGESSPSRHSASAFAIALTSFLIHPYLGIILCIIASLIAISRFIAGVHYMLDIILAICIAFIIYISFIHIYV